MNLYNYVVLEISRLFSNIYLYIGLLASLLFGGGIVYSIYVLNGPFNPNNVSGLFSNVSILALGLMCMNIVTRDLRTEVHQLIMINEKNRKLFVITRLILSVALSLTFSIALSLLLGFNYLLNKQGIDFLLISHIFIDYILFGMFFTSMFLTISLYYKNILGLTTLSFIIIMFLPGIISLFLSIPNIPEILKVIMTYIPIFSLTSKIASLSMNNWEILIALISSLLLYSWSFFNISKIDY